MNRILINCGKRIIKTCSNDRKSSLIQNDISSRFASNVPQSSASAIDKIIANQKHEIYGSLATVSHIYGSRRPHDVDLAVQNPRETSDKILDIIQRKGIRSEIYPNKGTDSYSVKVLKDGEMKTAVDVHPIQRHYKKYKVVYRSTMPPEKIGRFQVQSASDQQLRKGASVLKYEGADEHRRLKDETDFVVISRLMLDTKQLQAEAEMKKVQVARKSLEQIKRHVRKHRGYNAKDYPLNRDPIPASRKKQFINFAVSHPSTDVRNIISSNGKIKTLPQKKKKKHNNIFDTQNQAYKFWM